MIRAKLSELRRFRRFWSGICPHLDVVLVHSLIHHISAPCHSLAPLLPHPVVTHTHEQRLYSQHQPTALSQNHNKQLCTVVEVWFGQSTVVSLARLISFPQNKSYIQLKSCNLCILSKNFCSFLNNLPCFKGEG